MRQGPAQQTIRGNKAISNGRMGGSVNLPGLARIIELLKVNQLKKQV